MDVVASASTSDAVGDGESVYKRDSVPTTLAGRRRRPSILAIYPKVAFRRADRSSLLFDLASSAVPPADVAADRGALLPHRFTLA